MFLNILQGILFFRTFVPSYHTLLFIMAGIYLHVPFCASRCVYCDFYSTLHLEKRKDYIAALTRELRLRKHYLEQDGQTPAIQTVYIGGGTPSTLDTPLLEEVFNILYATYDIVPQAEITLEANPDDLTLPKIHELRTLHVNRLSIGVQTFDPDKLRLLHRRHTGIQALQAVSDCQDAGFENISIDLIYGLPRQSLEEWDADLSTALSLQVQHISAYALIYEEGTQLWKMRRQHIVEEADEELSLKMFDHLIDELSANGFEHYEISNFARPGFRSRHNSSYWQGIPYLGCGPSAHSYDGQDRQWNRPDLTGYIEHVGRASRPADFDNAPWIEKEELSLYERYNDRIVTALRTSDGLDLNRLKSDFGQTLYDHCLQAAAPHLRDGLIERISSTREKQVPNDLLKLTRRGLFLSDGIMSDLLYVAD